MLRFLSAVFPIFTLLAANHTYDCLNASVVRFGRPGYQYVAERTNDPITYWLGITVLIGLIAGACFMSVRVINIAWRKKSLTDH